MSVIESLTGESRIEKRRLSAHNYWKAHQERAKSLRRIRYAKNPQPFLDAARKYNKIYIARLRAETLSAYGNRCVCCGETEPRFLTIDHIDGGGREHIRSCGGHWYLWLRRHEFPKDKFRILCMNCNFASGHWTKICPHEESRNAIKLA